MKLAKLSLAAMVVAGLTTSSFAADTLADAFAKGKVSGTLEAQYISEDYAGAALDPDQFAVGGELKFITDSFYGFFACFTFQTSHTLGMDSSVAGENVVSINLQDTMLSEAYLTYTMKNTMVKVGRMYLATPLVASSGSRIMMDYFTGGIVVNTDLPQTTLIAGVVTKWTHRNSVVTTPEDPIYTLYAQNKSIAGLTATAQYVTLADVRDDYYAEVAYKLPMAFPLTVGAQYVGTSYDTAGTADGKLYGLMVGTAVAGVTLEAFYNNSTGDSAVSGGWGLGNDPSYNDMWLVNGLGANTESYSFKAGYTFSPELSVYAQYGFFSPDVANTDFESLDLDVMYKPGFLKGMSFNAKYSTVDYDTAGTSIESHLYFFAKYAF